MSRIQEVRVCVHPLDRFSTILSRKQMLALALAARRARDRLSRRVVWNISSTAVGGGVAEMLQSLLGYTRSVGIDSRWLVISGSPEFFRVTKRIHHALHGSAGDGSPLGAAAHRIYEQTLRENVLELEAAVRPGDVVLLHDPQTAGLAGPLLARGVHVAWRCHIGSDFPGPEAEKGWAFLQPYLADVPVFVFTRETYVPPMCDSGRSTVITPSIDAFCPKNQELSEGKIRSILVHAGLVNGPMPHPTDLSFTRDDGSPGRVHRCAEVVRLGRAPAWRTPLVVQISRWDPLKDMAGVMQAFDRLCRETGTATAELVLAGPDVRSVSDDPEGAEVFADVVERWRALPDGVRGRIHLASLPTADVEENAVIVNALQRHATVVVQKSLREGFGLTVTEAMWKRRPVVASAVGGIQDQIEDGVSGVLLRDPRDTDHLAEVLAELLASPERCKALGETAHERVRERFLGADHLLKYARLLDRLGVP